MRLPFYYHEDEAGELHEFIDYDQLSKQISTVWQEFYKRWLNRNDRMEKIDRVVTGDWAIRAPDDLPLDTGSPNLIQVALEDTAESATLVPSIRGQATKDTQTAQKNTEFMERLGQSYMEASEPDKLQNKSLLDFAAYGFFSWLITHDEKKGPRIQYRDARTAFPEPGFNSLTETGRAIFARNFYYTALPEEYQHKIREHLHVRFRGDSGRIKRALDTVYTLVEYFDADSTVIAVSYDSTTQPFALSPSATSYPNAAQDQAKWVSVIVEAEENPLGVCPVVIGQRPTLDGEPRGQFDQVIDVLRAHARLQGMLLDYSEQSVYSDIWYRDVIGDLPEGGGGLIELGPNGDIGRVPPATPSLSLYNEMASLLDAVHEGGRWPKSRMGDIDQAIASAKFIQATVGIMNTVVRTMHINLAGAIDVAMPVLVAADQLYGPEIRTVTGQLRNQRFLVERKKKDIDPSVRLRAEFGLGLGRDPAQSMVLGIQAAQSEIVSWDFVQENLEGITDVGLERARLDLQRLRDRLFGMMDLKIQSGELDEAALVKMAKDRMTKGQDLFELYEKYVIKPREEAMAEMLTSGLDGSQMLPGAAPEAGMMPPPAPAFEELFGGGGEDVGMVSRTSVPAGSPGSFAGVEAR